MNSSKNNKHGGYWNQSAPCTEEEVGHLMLENIKLLLQKKDSDIEPKNKNNNNTELGNIGQQQQQQQPPPVSLRQAASAPQLSAPQQQQRPQPPSPRTSPSPSPAPQASSPRTSPRTLLALQQQPPFPPPASAQPPRQASAPPVSRADIQAYNKILESALEQIPSLPNIQPTEITPAQKQKIEQIINLLTEPNLPTNFNSDVIQRIQDLQ